MDYKQIVELSEALNHFEDSEFYSLINENTAIIRNKKDSSLWTINFVLENEVFVFDTNKSEVVKKGTLEESFTLKDIARQIINESIFEKKSDIYEGMKDKILSEACKVKKDKKKKTLMDVSEAKKTTALFESISDTAKSVIETIVKKYSDKLNKFKEEENKFISESAFIFEDTEIKKEAFVDSRKILNSIEKKLAIQSSFYENVNSFIKFEESALNYLKGKNVPADSINVIFEGLSVGTSNEVGVTLTKNLLTLKKQKNLDLNISESTKELKNIYKDCFDIEKVNKIKREVSSYMEELENAYAKNPKTKYNYLKFKQGFTDINELKNLLVDFNTVISEVNNMSAEEFDSIVKMRQVVESMVQMNFIDDQLFYTVVGQFNEMFMKKQELQQPQNAVTTVAA